MSEKTKYLQAWSAEFRKTMKVLDSYPTPMLNFKPQSDLQSAKEIAWTFVQQEHLLDQALRGDVEPRPLPPAPDSLQELREIYICSHDEVLMRMSKLPEAEYDRKINFRIDPGRAVDFRRADILKLMLLDSARYRGQLSVYAKMANNTGSDL
jgi:hypothetical protein